MDKLKLKVINKMQEAGLSKLEVLFMLEIAKYQNKNGLVHGIYYKDICTNVGMLYGKKKMSYQRFYDVMRSLKDKGIISFEKGFKDYDITILHNDFTDDTYFEGYISVSHTMFSLKNFGQLKAGAMLLALELVKNCESNRSKKLKKLENLDSSNIVGYMKISKDKFYENYANKLGVSKRVLKMYVNSLVEAELFTFSVNKDTNMMFIQQRILSRSKKATKLQSVQLRTHELKRIFRKLKVKPDSKQFSSSLVYLNKFGKYLKDNVFSVFESTLYDMLARKNVNRKDPYKWDRSFDKNVLEKLLEKVVGLA